MSDGVRPDAAMSAAALHTVVVPTAAVGGTGSAQDTLGLALAGDATARDRLAKQYFPALRKWASGRLPPYARGLMDTVDLVQDAFERTYRQLDHFEPRSNGALLAYLRIAIRNHIRNLARDGSRRPQLVPLDDDLVDARPSPLENAECRESAQRYESALRRLKPREQALILCFDLQLSHAEVASTVCMRSPDAARMAMKRALLRLAEEIGSA
jgi:RNA polymerase sigma factor (sigma-70 family)